MRAGFLYFFGVFGCQLAYIVGTNADWVEALMLSLTSGTIGAVLGVVVGYFLWDKMWFRAFSAAVFVDVTGLFLIGAFTHREIINQLSLFIIPVSALVLSIDHRHPRWFRGLMLGLAVPAFINVALLPSASRSGGGDGFAVLGIIIIGIPLMLLCSLAGGMAGLISDRRTAKNS
ncbi:MAG: hypothetical protein AAB544_02060 [Patescibacteria group bacterium]